MTSNVGHDNDQQAPTPSNFPFLYQRHRSRLQTPQESSKNQATSHNDRGRRNNAGDKLAHAYGRDNPRSSFQPSRYNAVNQYINSPFLSSVGTSATTAAQYTSEWTKSIPFFAPTNPPSHVGSPSNYNSGFGGRHVPTTAGSTATSPKMRPSSFGSRQQTSPNRGGGGGRRPSVTGNRHNRTTSMGQPPLPNDEQAHFYSGGLPDMDGLVATAARSTGLCPGEGDYYCGFDTLSTCGNGPSSNADDVIVVGYEGGVLVYRVSPRQLTEIGRLEGLQGSVVGAKILPWTFRDDPDGEGRPYIALILHGPVLDARDPDQHHSSDESRSASYSDQDSSDGSPAREPVPGPPPDMHDVIKQYRTTVEIYSLMNRSHVATVYSAPPVEVRYNAHGEPRIPPPSGDLHLDAKGKFLVVASGVSGEVFVFSSATHDASTRSLGEIRCVGKLWTNVKRQEIVVSSKEDDTEDAEASTEVSTRYRSMPIFSLSERWIAITPPSAQKLFTLNGIARLAQNQSRPAGIINITSPAPPQFTCGTDQLGGSQIMSRLSRDVTQGVLKASKWIGEQGTSAWNAYWNPGNGSQTVIQLPDQQATTFPPTHGHQSSATPTGEVESRVAIYDLNRLIEAEEAQKESKNKFALTPLATFATTAGCSYVSFSPVGLSLITVGRKGDETTVWNLMRMHKEWLTSNSTTDENLGPYVRQLHKVTRLTTSNVVDICWTLDGSRFSIMTDKGTIHIHDIPPSMLVWPPSKRPLVVKEARRGDNLAETSNAKTRLGMAMDAASTAGNFIQTVRARSTSHNGLLGGLSIAPAVTAKGSSRMVTTGLKSGLRSIAFSADAIYHAADNKLHMQCLLNGAKKGLMRWMTGVNGSRLAICQGPIIRIYNVRQTVLHRKGQPALYRAKVAKKFRQLQLREIPADLFAPAFIKAVELRHGLKTDDKAAEPQLSGYWTLRSPKVSSASPQTKATPNWHVQIEAETNPPFQPFHTDRRSTLFSCPEPDEPSPTEPSPSATPQQLADYTTDLHNWSGLTFDTWLEDVHHFDQDIWHHGEDLGVEATRLAISDAVGGPGAGDGEEELENEVRVITGEGGEQVVVMTSVVKLRRAEADEEEDFFEDDCEVLEFAEGRV